MLKRENLHIPAASDVELRQNFGYEPAVTCLERKSEWVAKFRTRWVVAFRRIYNAAVQRYTAGARGRENLFTFDEVAFLNSIGCTPQELYDFVEDWCEVGEPPLDIVERITAVRRQYFRFEQKCQPSSRVVSLESLPAKNAKLGSFVWLPRIIAKARAKLRGEMPPELMYGCGADRSFLRLLGVDPAYFLRVVWDAGDDDQKILAYVLEKAIWP